MILILILIFITTSFFAIVQPKQVQSWLPLFIIVGLILILVAGFRKSGLDYANYLDVYYGTNQKPIEPAIKIIALAVKATFNNPLFFFLFFASLGVSIKLIAIKNLTNLWFLSAAIYISYYFMYHEMIQIRAGIVSGLLLLAIKPIYERNWKFFILLCAIGLTFHISALLIIPLWLLNGKSLKKAKYVGLLLISYIFAIIGLGASSLIALIPIKRIQLLYEGYLYSTGAGIKSDEINIFGSLQLLRIVVYLFILYYSDLITIRNKYAPLLIKIYALSISIFVLFSDLAVIAFRISQLLGIVEIIIIPMLIYPFTEKSKKIAVLFPIGIGCLMLGLMIFYRKLIS